MRQAVICPDAGPLGREVHYPGPPVLYLYEPKWVWKKDPPPFYTHFPPDFVEAAVADGLIEKDELTPVYDIDEYDLDFLGFPTIDDL